MALQETSEPQSVEDEPLVDQAVAELETFADWITNDGTGYAIWAAAAAAVFVGLRFLRAIVAGTLKSSKKPANAARNIGGEFVGATNSLFLVLLAMLVTLPFVGLELPERWATILRYTFMVMSILQLAFWARVVGRAVLEGVVTSNASDASTLESARSLLSLFLNVAIFAIAAIMILDNLGQDVGALIAGLGVGGIAIGLAAQNVFRDLFASLSIILDKPFVKGDFIVWDGYMGNIERIGLKTTRVRALSGEQLVVSNDDLLSNEIQNFKRMNERRIVQKVGVTYDTPRSALQAIPDRLKEIVEARENCRFDRAHMSGFGDSSINFEFVYYVLSGDFTQHMDEQQAILLSVHETFEALGAEFAFPSRTVYVEGLELPKAEASAS